MKRNHQVIASWVFGSVFSIFLMAVFFIDGGQRTHDPIVRWVAAIAAGLFGFFLTGSMKLISEADWAKLGKVTVQAGGGAAFFAIVWFSWPDPDVPKEKVSEIVRQTLRGSEVKPVREPRHGKFLVQCWIDQTSDLHIKGDKVHWMNFDGQNVPGWKNERVPTIINDYKWTPVWRNLPEPPRRGNGTSDAFRLPDSLIPNVRLTARVIQEKGRGRITVSTPEPGLIVVAFRDPADGQDTYEALVVWDEVFDVTEDAP